MGIKIGVCGAGQFARSFIPLFKAHPLVDEVCIAETLPERRRLQAERFAVARTYASLEEFCASGVDAIAICTQRWLHGPQAVAALHAGKHVYSAVPAAVTLEKMTRLVETVDTTGQTYMLGETSYYYPATIAASVSDAVTSGDSCTARASICTTCPTGSTTRTSAVAVQTGRRPLVFLLCSIRLTPSAWYSRSLARAWSMCRAWVSSTSTTTASSVPA